jgi:diguanylate cyclase (GGDEF)-like protein
MTWQRFLPARRLSVAGKFSLLLAVLVPCLSATAWVGARLEARMKADADHLYSEDVVDLQRGAELDARLAEAGRIALQIIPITRPDRLGELRSSLFGRLVPDVDAGLAELLATTNNPEEGALANKLVADWQQLKAIFDSPNFQAATHGPTDPLLADPVADQLASKWAAMAATLSEQRGFHADEAHQTTVRVARDNQRAHREMAVSVLAALLLGGGTLAWLIHDFVPRIRRYSKFAARVAAGEMTERLRPAGSDELSDLGQVLDDMVDRRVTQQDDDRGQDEFSEALQVAADEEEAHDLLKRHLERSLPGSTAVVLNRNNSANRLQAMTAPPEPSLLADRLAAAPPPRACLAVRLGRLHQETTGDDRLLTCTVCADTAPFGVCQPLLVSGEVIGAVLIQADRPLDAGRVADRVVLAAPVLANLRNLAIAEQRALTDALTGLPNRRASNDTLRRMAAQAARSVLPLAAVAVDLDHFKQINDLYGHDKGDDVLAAVGAALTGALRVSDFAARQGGEEFLILLPDTNIDAAVAVAEQLRRVIGALTIPAVERPITASLGVAVLPHHAGDAVTLLRQADRALYAAKAAGRNRTAVVDATNSNDDPPPPPTPNGAAPTPPSQDGEGLRRNPGTLAQ